MSFVNLHDVCVEAGYHDAASFMKNHVIDTDHEIVKPREKARKGDTQIYRNSASVLRYDYVPTSGSWPCFRADFSLKAAAEAVGYTNVYESFANEVRCSFDYRIVEKSRVNEKGKFERWCCSSCNSWLAVDEVKYVNTYVN